MRESQKGKKSEAEIEILEELPDLEKEDILAALKYASRKLDHPVIAA